MDRAHLFDQLAGAIPVVGSDAPIDVVARVRDWLVAGPQVFVADDRVALEALCRQIDVRRRISAGYGPGWVRLEPEVPVGPETVAGVVAVLLANAGAIGAGVGERDGGWGLKCVNSALKALDGFGDVPAAPELRAWALAVLDDRTGSAS